MSKTTAELIREQQRVKCPEPHQEEEDCGPPEDETVSGNVPVILVATDECRVNDQALRALAGETEVFHREGVLVRVLRLDHKEDGRVNRPKNAPVIRFLGKARLRELLTRCARWAQVKGRKIVAAHPPGWCMEALLERGEYPGFRYLAGVIEAPALRPDGSVVDEAGWDEVTGLLYEPSGAFKKVPNAPTQEDARGAAALLFDLVGDFPFVGEAHKAAWLASLLTPLARPAIDGPCPLFLMEASTAGSGKSMLTDVVALIVTGRDMPRSALADENEEVRKTITAIAIEGERMVLLDNASGSFGCKALDEALTARTWKDRILGKSERTGELPLDTVFYASGNNLNLRGDTHRRVIPIRLEPAEEQPELRTGFKYPHLLDHVRTNRPSLVVASLTILRGHSLAGRPAPTDCTPLGSYESWSKVVRNAVWWATGTDPCGTRSSIAEEDRGTANIAELFDGWAELPGGTGSGLTTKEAAKLLNDCPEHYRCLRAYLAHRARGKSEKVTAASLGYALRQYRGRVVGNRRLVNIERHAREKVWLVASLDRGSATRGGDGDDGGHGSSPLHAREGDEEKYPRPETWPPSSPSPPETDGPEFDPWA